MDSVLRLLIAYRLDLVAHHRRGRVLESLVDLQAGRRVADAAKDAVVQPAAVFGSLAGVEEVDDVPEPALTARCEGKPEPSVRVGSHEREPGEHEANLSGADVVV